MLGHGRCHGSSRGQEGAQKGLTCHRCDQWGNKGGRGPGNAVESGGVTAEKVWSQILCILQRLPFPARALE